MNDLENARDILQRDTLAFALVRDGQELGRGTRSGIRELLGVLTQMAERARGASLADKVVGKAVALTASAFGIREIYSPLGSQAAIRVLQANGIAYRFDRVVPLIKNIKGDDICPLERLTMEIDEPTRAVAALNEFVKS